MNNTLYNSNNGFILLGILFILSMSYLAISCPCNDISNSTCVRYEMYGIQLNHFMLFSFIGFCFPSYFYSSQFFGIVWEFLEYIADHNDEFVKKYIGGCLTINPSTSINNNPLNHIVFRNEQKFLNPIDKFFGIKNSKIHGWHGSVAEFFINIIGFLFGYTLNKVFL